MEFEINRASKLYDVNIMTKYERPCKNAFEVFPEVWHIKIDTLEELMELIDEVVVVGGKRPCGGIIISGTDITIYDDHVE